MTDLQVGDLVRIIKLRFVPVHKHNIHPGDTGKIKSMGHKDLHAEVAPSITQDTWGREYWFSIYELEKIE